MGERNRIRPRLAALGVALLALASAVYPLAAAGSMGYWYDELWSVDAALGSLPRMLRLLAADVHPPLYHAALWLWVRVFGTGEVATRALSILALVAAVPFTYLLGRRLGLGRAATLGAAGAVGLCYAGASFALETRPYTFLLASCTAAAWLLVRASDRRGYGLAWGMGVAAVAVHYAALFTLLPLAVLFAYRDRDARKLYVAAGWLLALLPFMLILHDQAALFATYTWLTPPGWADADHVVDQLVGDVHGGAYATALLGLALALAARRKELRSRLWLAIVPCVLAAVAAVSYALQPIFHIRYVFALAPWLYLAAAYVADRLPHPALRGAAAALLIAATAYVTSQASLTKAEDWGAAAGYVRSHRQGELLVTTSAARWFSVYFPGIEVLDENDPAAAAAWVARNAGRSLWLLQARDYHATPVRRVLAEASEIMRVEEFAGSRAVLLRLR
jgi:uncharacterized membrane protein